jgi:glycerol-3-phosphate dehydrogenase
MIMRTETSVLFVIPWGEFWLVGTTDTPWDFKDGVEPSVTETDIDYLLDHVNRLLARPLTRADIVSSFAGLRPLVAPVDEKSTTSSISREHSIVSSREGVALIAGGKLTTYRVMAKDVVDYALKDEQHIPRCRTRRIPLIGSQALDKSPKTRKALASTYKVTPDTVDHLLSRYGDQVNAVLDLTRTDRSLLQELPGVTGYILAEVVYACQFEGALTLEDVLTRRLRVSMETCDRGASCARLVAEKMSMILNWPQGMADRQVVSYLTMLDHTRNA